MILPWLVALVLATNAAAIAVMGWDKRCAATGARRVPEMHLLGLAAGGGWFGMKLAQSLFRHKTCKQPFGRLLNLIPVGWILIGAGFALVAQ